MDIINLGFADDLLLFAKGDLKYVEMWVVVYEEFSNSTRLKINPSKCKAFFGNMGDEDGQRIQDITKFYEGQMPFRYLGIPFTSNKLNINHCLPLGDRILTRINH
ncbi:unnamed protein product [Lathyrus sativus]|nr:unnamed protein product [Lathyrus sativus]